MQKKLKTNVGKCETCGSNKLFNPESQSLDCPSCRSQTKINSEKGLFKHDLDNSNNLTHHKNETAKGMRSMQCQNCGACVVLLDYQTSAVCPYCNTNMIASNEQFDGLKPDSVVPFQFGKEKATQMFKEKLKSKWLAPSKFKNSINADEIKAYYFPAFIFDADCSTNYEGRLYNTEEVKNKDGTTDTVRKYFKVRGEKQTQHKDIEIEASLKLSQNELNSVRPYNFDGAYKYANEFIYGYALEQYSNSISEADKQAKTIMEREIRTRILNSHRHDGVDYLNMYPTFYNEKFSYCILPMYRINFSYKNKKYSNVMNGQTGKLAGSYPKSGAKITMIVLLSIFVFILPILLFALFALSVL